jgi:hypothetical protein
MKRPLAVVILAVLPSSALAQGESSIMRAERRFKEGEQLFDAKKIAEACAAFAESHDLDPKLGTLLNLAFCHETQGRTATAWNEFNEAAAWAAQRGQSDREAFAHQRAMELARKMPRVEVEVAPGITLVEIDDEPLPRARWGKAIFVDPGEHRLRAAAPNKKPRLISFRVEPGISFSEIVLAPLEDEPPPTPKVEDDAVTEASANRRRTLTFIVGGVGVLGLAIGTFFGVRTLQKRDAARTHCAGSICDAQGVESYDDAHTAATVSTIAYGIGLAAGAAATYLLITAPSRARPVTVSVRGMGLSVEGRW